MSDHPAPLSFVRMTELPCAWMGDVPRFLAASQEDLLASLTRFVVEKGGPQLAAWDRSLSTLRDAFEGSMPAASGFGVVLEFELHRGGGRRPDLIVLENGTVLVVEFKNRVEAEASDFDQVRGYVRDLEEYHGGCRDRLLVPVLVPIGSSQPSFERDGVYVTSPAGLGALIREHARKARGGRAGVETWTAAPCNPLPALIEAARLLFEKKPLPEIRRAASAKIPETVALVESIARDSIERTEKTLILLTGVPGSGKTLVGLSTAHSRELGMPAAFL